MSISCLIHGSSSQRLSHTCCHLSTSIFCAKTRCVEWPRSSGNWFLAFWQLSLYLEVTSVTIDFRLQDGTDGMLLADQWTFPYWIYHDRGGFVSSCSSEFQKWFNENTWRLLRSQLFDDVGEFLKAVLVLATLATSHPSQQGTPNPRLRHPSDDPTSVRHLHLLGVSPGDHQKGILLLENHHLSQHPIAAETTKEQLAKAADVSLRVFYSLLVFSLKWVILSPKRYGFGWNIIFEKYQIKTNLL